MKPLIVCRSDKTKYMTHIAEAVKAEGALEKAYAYIAYYDEWRDSLDNDTDIQFEKTFGTREIFKSIDDVPVDQAELTRIEQKYGDSQLWALALTERWLISPAAYPIFAKIPFYNEEQKRQYWIKLIQQAEDIFENHDIDCVYDFANIGIFRMALDVVAQKHNIPYYHIDSALITDLEQGDRFFIARRLNDNYDFLDEAYDHYLKNPDEIKEGKAYLERFRSPQSTSVYSQWYGSDEVFGKKGFLTALMGKCRSFARECLKLVKYAVNDVELYSKAAKNPEIRYNFALYKNDAVSTFVRNFQKFYRGFYTKYCCKFETEVPSYKYTFITLHMQPEASTALMAPFEVNQLAVIENIAKALPMDHLLLVKFNKVMYGKDQIPFIRQLKNMPNVRLVDHYAPTMEFLKKATCIITITGTIGFEGALLGKKVILLGDRTMPWAHIKSIQQVREWRNLHKAIRAAEDYKIEDVELTAYLQAVHDNSFPIEKNFVWDTSFDFDIGNAVYKKVTEDIGHQIVKIHTAGKAKKKTKAA